MSDIKSLKSYLVSLGFDVNKTQYNKFESSLKEASALVGKTAFTMGADLLKWQFAVTGMFVGVSTAIAGTIAKVASADQEYRLFGQRMMMNTEQARSLKITLDALGQPLEAIAFDPELHSRYVQLTKDQKLLAGGLGGDYAGTMKQIRDVTFEFTRLEVEFKYFTMGVAKEIFQALGGGDFVESLHSLNDWIIKNIPEWSQQFSTYLVPILKDTWEILKDIGSLVLQLGGDFTSLIATLSGDTSIDTQTLSFESFAKSLEHVVFWAKESVLMITGLERVLVNTAAIAYNTGQVIGYALLGNFDRANSSIGKIKQNALGIVTGLDAIGGAALPGGLGGDAFNGSGAGNGAAGSRGVGNISLETMAGIIMWQESRGDPNATNHNKNGSTDYGLMQLNDRSFPNASTMSPAQNYATGTAYLKQLYSRYGNWTQALEAYNGGALNVDNGTVSYAAQKYASQAISRANQYSSDGGGSVTNVGGITVHVANPNANPEEIAHKVIVKLEESTALRTKRSLAQTRSVYA